MFKCTTTLDIVKALIARMMTLPPEGVTGEDLDEWVLEKQIFIHMR